ncbi:MAG: EAL domain-containing protein [Halomonadaceae bacterium]|nr:MAG: EAL domain-containing protein [Halomonadaceae bacterium]
MTNARPADKTRLHRFLREEYETILREWESCNRQTLASSRNLPRKELRNNLPTILHAIADQAERASTLGVATVAPQKGPQGHAQERWQLGFTLEEVTREYSLLRQTILKQLATGHYRLSTPEMVLLNASLDQAVIEAVNTFVSRERHELENERRRLEVILSSIADAVVCTDAQERVVYLNPAAETMTGWSLSKASQRPVREVLITQTDRNALMSDWHRDAKANTELQEPSPEAMLLQRRSGELVPVEQLSAPLRDDKGNLLGTVITFRDMSTLRAMTSRLSYLAHYDALTGLPKRTLLQDRLTQAVTHAQRNNSMVAILMLDLDLFKQINNVHGHTIGDMALKAVAHRLKDCVGPTDTVSYLGGDEFAILVSGFTRFRFLCDLAEKLTHHLNIPLVADSHTLHLTAGIGISLYPDDSADPETLLHNADIALNQAKSLGRNRIRYYAPDMNQWAQQRNQMENDLSKALAKDQLSLNYQPQFALSSGQLVGSEALLRWRHPQQGWVSPATFIQVAEESGELMVAIGEWVLEQALQQSRDWRNKGYHPVPVSVNLSLAQLRHSRFVRRAQQLLQEYQMPPQLLQLELTESIILNDIEGAQERIQELKALGVNIAIDDFGTGYSSLSYLKDLPVDELKIDRSFIEGLDSNQSNTAIVQAIVRMGQSLGLHTLAEGVEDQRTADILKDLCCASAQGYHFSRPVTADIFARMFLTQGTLHSRSTN